MGVLKPFLWILCPCGHRVALWAAQSPADPGTCFPRQVPGCLCSCTLIQVQGARGLTGLGRLRIYFLRTCPLPTNPTPLSRPPSLQILW